MVIKSSLCRRTLDNVTCVLVCFDNFEKVFNALAIERKPKLNPSTYNSTESSSETKTPKVQKTETSESKLPYSTYKESKEKYDSLRSPKAVPVSAKHKNNKIGSLLDNIKDYSLIKDKKRTSFDNINNNSFYKNDQKSSKIYKKISTNIDPVKLKLNNNNFLKKFHKKEFLSGYNSTKNNSKVSSTSIDKRLKMIKKEKSVNRGGNTSNINNSSNVNKSTDKNLTSVKKTHRLDFSENFSDSKFSDLKRKFGLQSDSTTLSSSKAKPKNKFC
jgi:hypothetical protein